MDKANLGSNRAVSAGGGRLKGRGAARRISCMTRRPVSLERFSSTRRNKSFSQFMHARSHFVLLITRGRLFFFSAWVDSPFYIRDEVFRHVGVSSVLIS